MSMSQDWDLDTVVAHSRVLKIDPELAVKKYYEIYRYLKTDLKYTDDFKCMEDSVTRTKNWLTAYATGNK